MPGPSTAPCQPWATWDDVAQAHCDAPELSADLQTKLLSISTDVLRRLAVNNGAPEYGICEITIRPCRRCICDCDCCACPPYYSVRLTNSPVVEVSEVIINGQVFDDWWVDDYGVLKRADQQPWPYCQDTAKADADATFKVIYQYGLVPPPSAVSAAAEFTYQLALGQCNDRRCELPKRATTITREGVTMTMLDPMSFLRDGKTGLYYVDLWLASFSVKSAGGGIFHPGMRRTNIISHTSQPSP